MPLRRPPPHVAAVLTEVPQGLPAQLRELYGLHQSLSDRSIAPVAALPKLRKSLDRWVTSCLDDCLEEDFRTVERGCIHLLALSPHADLVPFGENGDGDLFFFDPALQRDGDWPVLRFCHEEAFVCRVEASSLGAFVALRFLQQVVNEYSDGWQHTLKLQRRERKLAHVPRGLHRAPKQLWLDLVAADQAPFTLK